jgi:hypothetical protein
VLMLIFSSQPGRWWQQRPIINKSIRNYKHTI